MDLTQKALPDSLLHRATYPCGQVGPVATEGREGAQHRHIGHHSLRLRKRSGTASSEAGGVFQGFQV